MKWLGCGVAVLLLVLGVACESKQGKCTTVIRRGNQQLVKLVECPANQAKQASAAANPGQR